MTEKEKKAINILNDWLCEAHSEFCKVGAVGIPSKEWYATETVLNLIQKQDTEINKLKKQLQNISDEFLKYDWKNATQEQVYNQLKSLYESIFMKEDK